METLFGIKMDWLLPVGTLAGSLALGIGVYLLLYKIAGRLAEKTKTVVDDALVRHCKGPAGVIVPLLVVYFFLPIAGLPAGLPGFLEHLFSLILIITIAWLIIQLTFVLEDVVLDQFQIDTPDNLRARRIKTQLEILKKIVIITVGILALAVFLMTFKSVRQLGASILASAGIAGIIIGFAAQRSIATLIAGLQIAITQPIRLDDVVIVENEWGWIEEITLTYVVVRIWDLRRLILPITYFLEKPFQNWTRRTADILGTVFIYVDYSVPVRAVREELQRILESSGKWDGRVAGLQVTNATERTVELRALMSAPDSSTAWDLRCEVREKLIDFIQQRFPNGLPKLRAEVGPHDRS